MGTASRTGAWGEALAAEYLREKGFSILAAGFRCRYGEIDLIAQDGRYLAFVEVKLRRSGEFARAMEFVDEKKREKLRATASIYLSEYRGDLQPRFDVIEIYAPKGTRTERPEIHHMEDAFQ